MTATNQPGQSVADLRDLALPALITTAGLQLLRVFLPSVSWYLLDTVGASWATVAAFAVSAFLAGHLAAPLRRLLGPRFALYFAAAGVAAFRLAEQAVHQPAADLGLSLAGTAFFLLFLPVFIGHARALQPERAAFRLGGGLILGINLDTAIKGAAGTLDLSWWRGLVPLLLVAAMAIATLWLLWREPIPGREALSEASWGRAAACLGIGPYLFLQGMVLQNLGWASQVAGLQPPSAYLVVMLGGLVGALGLWVGLSRPYSFRPLTAAMVLACLVLAISVAPDPTPAFVIDIMVAQFVTGWGLAALLWAASEGVRPGLGHTALMVHLGMILFLILTFAYYSSFMIALPFSRETYLPSAAAVFGLCVLAATVTLKPVRPAHRPSVAIVACAVVLLLPTGLVLATYGPPPAAQQPAGLPARVLTYNIHSAYASDGAQDPEAIARVIEASGADIVALQEVSRGWLIDGSTDLLAFLSHRLRMQALFKGTADPVWGNAILTRLPITASGSGTLPLAGTQLPRGYLWATLDTGGAQPWLVIATHLHHVEADHEVRLIQVPALIDFWADRPFTILLGDLNSEPSYPEMALLSDAGLKDAWSEAGQGPGLTWPARAPFERIDWVWHSADLQAVEAALIDTTASDHLPLVVTLDLAR